MKDQKYILQAKQEAQEEAAQQAYDRYEVERRNFKNLKANEAAEKKQQAQVHVPVGALGSALAMAPAAAVTVGDL